ncbi:hypothetical protein J2T12_002951 [Paenibacillus anaericanus]|uniref:Uncharacterized protein n=1 Tax=Paenibacillus anaericanus TaxID=170367 RepID=A0A433Y721_9BACL|nr:hypothetical protein [Paenibacillus anaericanus]MDQ0089539.1 hypothetical protein [Paenibacillus anaericanus]RUT45256.1 hypothetical protein EJP82_16395 [Paenibacillus anaericanus]
MRGYNIMRPLMLIIVALLTRGLVTNLCILFGMTPESASSIGMFGMIIAAIFMYIRLTKRRPK